LSIYKIFIIAEKKTKNIYFIFDTRYYAGKIIL